MRHSLDLIGKRFGKLVVVAKTDKRHRGYVVWECKCDCGNTIFRDTTHLTQGKVKSCGCVEKVGMKVWIHGELITFKDAAKKYNISERTIRCRYARGERGDDLVVPNMVSARLGFGDKAFSMTEIAKMAGCSRQNISLRYKKGLRGEELLRKGKLGRPSGTTCSNESILFGEYTSVQQIAEKAGVSTSCIWQRYDRGYRGEGLINPVRHKNRRTK